MKQDPKGMHVFQLVRRDHQVVRELFDMFNKSTTNDEKQLTAYHLIREISMHSAAEEMTWYLKLEEKLGMKGKDYYDRSVKEHQQLKEDVDVLNNQKVTDPEFQPKFHAVVTEFNEHAGMEEKSVLPDLEKAMSPTELSQLTEDWNSAKAAAPTRPHPNAGTPAPSVAARASALIDKTADLARFGMEKGREYTGEQAGGGVTTRQGATTGGGTTTTAM
jgi:hemerythrin superfamily protein